MDDFHTGPHSFTLFLESKDIFNFPQSHSGHLNIFLPKPIDLTPGTWEVCLKRMILTPCVVPRIGFQESSLFVYYKNNETYQGETVFYDTSNLNAASAKVNDYINVFNASIPEIVRNRVKLSNKNDRLELYADNVQVKFKDKNVAKLLGFTEGLMYPPRIGSNKTFLAPFNADTRNGYHICKIVTDFTAPIAYGSSFFSIVAICVLPDSKIPIDVVFPGDMYVQVIKNFISKISISILDFEDKPFPFADCQYPIILQLNFRRQNNFV